MNVQAMCRVAAKGSVIAVLFFSMSASAMPVAAYVLAHPPVIGDCASCHPDVKTMPRII